MTPCTTHPTNKPMTSPVLFFCDSCGALKPDLTPGRACPAGCGSRVTASRPPATIAAALAILEANGWDIRTSTGHGHIEAGILIHAGPSMAALINCDPQAYGYPEGTVVVDAPAHEYTHRSASEPWQLTPATVEHPGPDTGTPEEQ